MAQPTALILNPQGNHHRDGRQWIAAQRACLRELAPANVSLVESVEEAAQAAHHAALNGYRKIVSVGETATALGVVNGLMRLAEGHRTHLRVGFLSFSRPDLWSRTLDLPRRLSRQLELISAGHTLPFDVGRVECQGVDGGRVTRHFLNGATFGIVSALREQWQDPQADLVQTLPRLARTVQESVEPGSSRVRLESLGRVLFEGDCSLGLLMGGRYYSGFGRVAPQADPSDGRLELAWLGRRPWWALALHLLGLWLRLPQAGATLEWQGVGQLRALSLSGAVPVEVDGHVVGRLPATFSVLPRALPVIVAPVAIKLRKPVFKPVDKLANGRLVGNIKSAAGL